MQPSSLIFLVIIGVWAAYFVQYWVRRREHLATIRSVDAFSETMRVLERRAPLPSVDHGGQAPRTYAVSPARAMRPQVTVKRAEAHVAAPAPAPIAVPVGHAVAEVEGNDMAEPLQHAMRPGRGTRGIVVLVGLAGTLVFGLLSVLGVLKSWSFLVPMAMAGGGFLWLRAGIQAELKALRAARGRARRAAGRASAPVGARAAAPAARAATPVAAERSAQVDVEVAHHEVASEPVAAAAPFDGAFEVAASTPVVDEPVQAQPVAEAVEHEVPLPALPELDEDDIPLTWDPRPVPRPTYTMKARAPERAAPAPEAAPAAEAEHPAYDEVLERRTGSF